jgi:hypothetical protein
LGFASQLIQVVIDMVRSVSFSALFNGNKFEGFKPTLGITQCNSISPYVYLLAARGLLCLLKINDQSSRIGGIKVGLSALVVNHLLFADANLLFSKGSSAGAEELFDLLEIYCEALGRINKDKSSIFFHKRMSTSFTR